MRDIGIWPVSITLLVALSIICTPCTARAEDAMPAEDQDRDQDSEHDTYDEAFEEGAADPAQPDVPRMGDRPIPDYLGTILTGWLMYTFSFAASVFGGTLQGENGHWEYYMSVMPLWGPLALGAALLSGEMRADGSPTSDDAVGVLYIVYSALQMIGVSLLIYGHVRRRQVRGERDGRSRRASIAFVPSGPGGPGASVTGFF